jgi:hypothetical protein
VRACRRRHVATTAISTWIQAAAMSIPGAHAVAAATASTLDTCRYRVHSRCIPLLPLPGAYMPPLPLWCWRLDESCPLRSRTVLFWLLLFWLPLLLLLLLLFAIMLLMSSVHVFGCC